MHALGEVLSAIDQIISSLICMCSGTEGADITSEGEETGVGMSAFELDENEQTGLYDLDSMGVPAAWQDGDADSQDVLTRHILSRERRRIEDDSNYERIPKHDIPLSRLRQYYDHKDDRWYREKAIDLLTKRITVTIDGDMMYEWDDSDLVWSRHGVSRLFISNDVLWDWYQCCCVVAYCDTYMHY